MAEVIRMDENTYRIEDGFVRFFLLAGEDKAMLIDSGVECGNAKEIAETLTNLPIELYNTHGDGDHLAGSAMFDIIHMHTEDYERCGVGHRFPDLKLSPVNDGDVIDLGGRKIEVIHIPGHTYGSIAFLDISARRLFVGDSVQSGHVFMFGDKRDVKNYPHSLEKLIRMKERYDTVIPSHDKPELSSDYPEKMLETWNKTEDGTLGYTESDMFGAKIKVYDGEYCGFFRD